MNKNEISQYLFKKRSAVELSRWLRTVYFPEITTRFNNEEFLKRFALYQNEKIPTNERNLTDVRTRMGVLIEFELARISNDLFHESNVHNIFLSYVVANRFPDLEVRDNSGNRYLRFEIKCLQCKAEEKSANFDTLKKDIDPSSDFVIVCLWDWVDQKNKNIEWDSFPKIFKVFIFHAYSLASLRDTYWLNTPPQDLGEGYQGFDIRYAITCKKGIYSKEQGNYGKLTRIKTKADGFNYSPQETAELIDTENEYNLFKEEIIFLGFKIIAQEKKHLGMNSISLKENGNTYGFKKNHTAFLLSSKLNKKIFHETSFYITNNLTQCIVMTDKYKSTIYKLKNKEIKKIKTDIKPKKIIDFIDPV